MAEGRLGIDFYGDNVSTQKAQTLI